MSLLEQPIVRLHRGFFSEPLRCVTVYDTQTFQMFLRDVLYVSEENLGEHQYLFKFKNGGERLLDLRGHNYRIVRRMV